MRPRIVSDEVLAVLIKIWKMMDYICGKRLQPALAEIIDRPGTARRTELSRQTRVKLIKISSAAEQH